MFKDIRRRFGAAQNDRFALRLLMADGIKQRALQRNFTVILKQSGFEALNTMGHEELLWTRAPDGGINLLSGL
ncbi:Uncharacterised protein [Salmonella enterica subsp. enterica serovar Braenderup]|nr:Uncharacterised protein [Salmonella enterica subsp. enterica serovar Braenderup]